MSLDKMQSEAEDWIKQNGKDIWGSKRNAPVTLHAAYLATGLLSGVVIAALTKKEYLLPASIVSYLALEGLTSASLVPLSNLDMVYREKNWDVVDTDEATGSILMAPKPATWARFSKNGDPGWAGLYLGNDGKGNALIGIRPDLYKKNNSYMEYLPGVILHEVTHHKQLYTTFNPYQSGNFKAYQPYIEFEAKVIGYEKYPDSMNVYLTKRVGLKENWNSSNLTKPQLRDLFEHFYGGTTIYNMDMTRKEKVVDWFHNKYYGKERKLIPANQDAAIWRFFP